MGHRTWDSIAGTWTDSIAGTRTDSIAGTRTVSIAGTRTDSVAGTRTDSIAGTRTDSIAGTRTIYELNGPRFEFRCKQGIFSFPKPSTSPLGRTHPPIQCVSLLFPKVKATAA